jgi:predicted transcriptional regulator
MKRRTELDIACDLLSVARTGAKKTFLVYQTNLNFRIIKKYIQNLIDTGLLQCDSNIYTTTDKGKTFVRQYKALRRVYQQ